MNLQRPARNAVDRLRQPQFHREPQSFWLIEGYRFDHTRLEKGTVGHGESPPG
nr:hypothetical protein [Paraburkholderia ribeironis]